MKSRKELITIESLPREIILQILTRLPTQSLLNAKLVCHSWYNLSQDPLLTNIHFTRHFPEKTPFLSLHSDYPIKNKLYSLHLFPHNNNHGIVNEIPLPNLSEFDFVGSCDGLLCLCDSLHKTSFHIYNPFTRDLITLPELASPSDVWSVFGLGFNKSTNEYKVLKFSPIQRNGRHNIGYRARSNALIITVGGHEWRSLGQIAYYPIREPPSQVVVNGRLHWSDWPRRYGPSRLLVSFDLDEEKFEQVPKPEWGRGGYTLLVLRGCLSAAVYGNDRSFDVWVMREYGVGEAWTKDFIVGFHQLPKRVEDVVDPCFKVSKFFKRSCIQILCGLRNGEIMLVYKHRALVCYNPMSGEFKDVKIPGMPVWFEACCSNSSASSAG